MQMSPAFFLAVEVALESSCCLGLATS